MYEREREERGHGSINRMKWHDVTTVHAAVRCLVYASDVAMVKLVQSFSVE